MVKTLSSLMLTKVSSLAKTMNNLFFLKKKNNNKKLDIVNLKRIRIYKYDRNKQNNNEKEKVMNKYNSCKG